MKNRKYPLSNKYFLIFLIIFLIIIFLTFCSFNIYAKESVKKNWATSYISNSSLILSASASLIFSFTGMLEMNLGQFYFGSIPLNYCLGFIVPIFIQSNSFSLAFSPLLTVHLGLTSIPLEFIEGVGLGIGFETIPDLKAKIGFTALFQLNYYLAKTSGIFLQISMVSGFTNWGFGLFFTSTGGKK